ncbi:unnamed protein product [Thlaspi arvense]|uniref:Uncharacterized protein n=1 Tax=Thlaspi arvense TaxID=13288 RepID=A0AAU9T974_THLAR|nr:unnamed protein product [Thlaspi arvense]
MWQRVHLRSNIYRACLETVPHAMNSQVLFTDVNNFGHNKNKEVGVINCRRLGFQILLNNGSLSFSVDSSTQGVIDELWAANIQIDELNKRDEEQETKMVIGDDGEREQEQQTMQQAEQDIKFTYFNNTQLLLKQFAGIPLPLPPPSKLDLRRRIH